MTIQQKRQRAQKTAAKKRQRARSMPSPHAFAYTQSDAQAMGAPGRTRLYELRMAGVLEWFVDEAGRVMIKGSSLRRLLHAEPTNAAT